MGELSHHGAIAEIESRLDALHGRTADELRRLHDFDGGEACGVLLQRLHGYPQARQDDASEVVAGCRHHIDRRRGSEVDHDQVASRIEMNGADGVRDSIRTYLQRISISNPEAGLCPGLQNEGLDLEIFATAAPQRIKALRHHRTDRNLMNVRRIGAVLPEHTAQKEAKLV